MSSLSAVEAKLEAESKTFQLLQKGDSYTHTQTSLIKCMYLYDM